jgi:hypothetical protein
MDILADQYESDIERPKPSPAVLHAVPGIVKWLIGFFTLTEEDRLKVGIYFGGEGRDK